MTGNKPKGNKELRADVGSDIGTTEVAGQGGPKT